MAPGPVTSDSQGMLQVQAERAARTVRPSFREAESEEWTRGLGSAGTKQTATTFRRFLRFEERERKGGEPVPAAGGGGREELCAAESTGLWRKAPPP